MDSIRPDGWPGVHVLQWLGRFVEMGGSCGDGMSLLRFNHSCRVPFSCKNMWSKCWNHRFNSGPTSCRVAGSRGPLASTAWYTVARGSSLRCRWVTSDWCCILATSGRRLGVEEHLVGAGGALGSESCLLQGLQS